MNKEKFIADSLNESAETKQKILQQCKEDILRAVDILTSTFRNNNKLLLCGNGGSAADCQHIATELVVRLSHHIKRPALPAIALTTDSSNITAGGNDIGFENIFARGVEAYGRKGDALIAISTSGNSENVFRAVRQAKDQNVYTIGLLGSNGGKIAGECDESIVVPSDSTARTQESHIMIGHIWCEIIEETLCPEHFNPTRG